MLICAHHDVSSPDKLQPGLHDQDVQDVDEVTGVVGQQPQVDVFGGLVRESPADRDQPHVPVPCCHHEEQPDHIDQVCGGGGQAQRSKWLTDSSKHGSSTVLKKQKVFSTRCKPLVQHHLVVGKAKARQLSHPLKYHKAKPSQLALLSYNKLVTVASFGFF